MTLLELAKKHGQFQGARVGGDDPFTALHNVAVMLNGLARHERTTGESVSLTDAEYLAALEEAKKGKPHAPVNKRKAAAPIEPIAEPKKRKEKAASSNEGVEG